MIETHRVTLRRGATATGLAVLLAAAASASAFAAPATTPATSVTATATGLYVAAASGSAAVSATVTPAGSNANFFYVVVSGPDADKAANGGNVADGSCGTPSGATVTCLIGGLNTVLGTDAVIIFTANDTSAALTADVTAAGTVKTASVGVVKVGPTYSVGLQQSSATSVVGAAAGFTAKAMDVVANPVAGQVLNVEVTSASLSATLPLGSSGLTGAASTGIAGAWKLTGTVTTGADGTAAFSVTPSTADTFTVRVYAGTPPFTAGQPNAVTSHAVTALAAAPDRVTSLALSPATDTRSVGAGQSVAVVVRDVSNAPVAAVLPVGAVTGVNAASAVVCTLSDVNGASTCSYANPNLGADTLTIHVNKTVGGTPGIDAGEVWGAVTRGTVTVISTDRPVLTVPGRIVVTTTSPKTRVAVTFTVSATDPVDGSLLVTCDHQSGSLFKLGTTKVRCSATNHSGVTTWAHFAVKVKLVPRHHHDGGHGRGHGHGHGD